MWMGKDNAFVPGWFRTIALLFLLVPLYLFAGCGTASIGPNAEIASDESLNNTEGGPALADGGDLERSNSNTNQNNFVPDAGPGTPSTPNARRCPNNINTKPTSSFEGTPCQEDQDPNTCASGCLPTDVANKPSGSNLVFFKECNKEEVLCVGPNGEVQTLTAASKEAARNDKITTIQIASGVYQESVTFAGIQRDLTIEGQSNDPNTGTRIIAPLPAQAIKDYAAIRVTGVKNLTVQRLVLSGYGHGLFVNDFVSVNINQSHHTANMLTGALLQGSGKVTVTKSHFVYNGGLLRTQFGNDTVAVNINQSHRVTGQGTISVNINQSHRTTDQVAVNINQSHRIPGLGADQVSVNINQSHRVVGQRSSYVEALRFGLVIEGASDINLQENRVSHNALGGARLSPGGSEIAVNINQSHRVANNDHIAVNINQSHRVAGNDTVAVNINQSHRVVMKGNAFLNNGPRGWFARSGATSDGCASSCGDHHFCEGEVCLPSLHTSPKQGSQKGALFLAGMGALIAGQDDVTLEGNTFFRNDMSGVIVHSVGRLTFRENALERNGVRPGTLRPNRFLFAGLRAWGISTSVGLHHNLITDHSHHGVYLSDTAGKHSSTGSLKVSLVGNHVEGAGRFAPGELATANGAFLANDNKTRPMELTIDDNYFSNNRRSGLNTTGYVVGVIQGNRWLAHPNRAVVIHDTHSEKTAGNQLTFQNNRISGASGYGLQIFGGGARVIVTRNILEGTQRHSSGDSVVTEGDALNLASLTSRASVTYNLIRENSRAGIFLHSIQATVENNNISNCKYGMHAQSGTVYDGKNSMSGNSKSQNNSSERAQDFPNRKDF